MLAQTPSDHQWAMLHSIVHCDTSMDFILFLFQIVCVFRVFELKESHFPDFRILRITVIRSIEILKHVMPQIFSNDVDISRVFNMVTVYLQSDCWDQLSSFPASSCTAAPVGCCVSCGTVWFTSSRFCTVRTSFKNVQWSISDSCHTRCAVGYKDQQQIQLKLLIPVHMIQ